MDIKDEINLREKINILERIEEEVITKGEKIGTAVYDGCDMYEFNGFKVVDASPPYIFEFPDDGTSYSALFPGKKIK